MPVKTVSGRYRARFRSCWDATLKPASSIVWLSIRINRIDLPRAAQFQRADVRGLMESAWDNSEIRTGWSPAETCSVTHISDWGVWP